MGIGNSGKDPGEAAHLEEMENRPVRVRPPGIETDGHPHKHRRTEAERIDREWPMQGRRMHRNRDRERKNGTTEPDNREQQREASGQREEGRRQIRVDDESSSQCARGGPTESDHTSAVKGKPTPGKGSRRRRTQTQWGQYRRTTKTQSRGRGGRLDPRRTRCDASRRGHEKKAPKNAPERQ